MTTLTTAAKQAKGIMAVVQKEPYLDGRFFNN